MGRQEVPPHGNGSAELERLALFSDAVFAIAITLLVLELKVPGHAAVAEAGGLGAALIREIPRFYAFLISFVVIGNYWVLHHRMFRYIRRCDEPLVLYNLLILLLVAFLPFPVALFGEYRRDPVAIGWYATTMALAGLGLNLLWGYATGRGRLVAPDLDRRIARGVWFQAIAVPVMFTVSLPFAFVSRNWTTYSMVAMALVLAYLGRRIRDAARQAEHEAAREEHPALPVAVPAAAPTAPVVLPPAGAPTSPPPPTGPAPGP